ncbi:hypothetical protein MtrunA17_Chr7g0272681 [Medicago truncatula]|uniref:Transmembrane protein n=1 Tax=Medicago truncatula TaxID=3880 RepID=A0A396H7N5_MEDTR|nr:hypothetical protein MtrunA17_Chr7g0272681 [Medicago truncatula]
MILVNRLLSRLSCVFLLAAPLLDTPLHPSVLLIFFLSHISLLASTFLGESSIEEPPLLSLRRLVVIVEASSNSTGRYFNCFAFSFNSFPSEYLLVSITVNFVDFCLMLLGASLLWFTFLVYLNPLYFLHPTSTSTLVTDFNSLKADDFPPCTKLVSITKNLI